MKRGFVDIHNLSTLHHQFDQLLSFPLLELAVIALVINLNPVGILRLAVDDTIPLIIVGESFGGQRRELILCYK